MNGGMKSSAETNAAGKKLIKKEAMQSGNIKRSVYYNYFKACGLVYTSMFLLLSALGDVSLVLSNFWLSNWSNKQLISFNAKWFYYSIFFLLGFLKCIFAFVGDILANTMLIRASKKLHESLLDSILKRNMQFFESTPIGRILNRFSKDVEATETKIPDFLRMFVKSFLNVLSVVIVLSITQPLFLIFFIPIFLAYTLVQRFYGNYARQMKRMESVSRSSIYAFFGESINGISTIRAFGSQNRYTLRMQEFLDANIQIFYMDMYGNRWVSLRLEFIGSFVVLFASMFAVFQKDTISAGVAGLSLTYAISITQSLIWLVKYFSEFESNLTSVERIKEYCVLTEHESEWEVKRNKSGESWPVNGEIVFKDYSVKYRKELDFALNEISFEIKPGEKIGIVGRTGAGKTSLILSLFRILESNNGSIFIDDVNIRDIGLHDLRKKLTVIPQDSFLFSSSLRLNLDPFGYYTDAQIWSALELTHLKEFVSGLERKLDFECCEGGENLSVGQRQLICLARALLKKTKILVLDEATASIDAQTDELIQQTIRKEFAKCTVLTIAHRLNTILQSDRILVLDKGKIAEFDSPEALLSNKNTIFHSMAVSAGIV